MDLLKEFDYIFEKLLLFFVLVYSLLPINPLL